METAIGGSDAIQDRPYSHLTRPPSRREASGHPTPTCHRKGRLFQCAWRAWAHVHMDGGPTSTGCVNALPSQISAPTLSLSPPIRPSTLQETTGTPVATRLLLPVEIAGRSVRGRMPVLFPLHLLILTRGCSISRWVATYDLYYCSDVTVRRE